MGGKKMFDINMFNMFNSEIVPTSANVPKKKVCRNCHQSYIDGDKYCRFCGAPMGKPDYTDETFACIYGPLPTKRVHKCTNCGYVWETMRMTDSERFCPKCGGSAPYEEDLESFSLDRIKYP